MPRPLSDDESWIVSHNLLLVDSCLRGRRRYDDATWHDLRAAGYLGLCRAITLYDPRIAMWSTYACVWIKSFIQREIRIQANLIEVPEYQQFAGKTEQTTTERKNKRPDYLRAAQIVMSGHRVRWDEREAIASLAVAPTEEAGREINEVLRACVARLPSPHREIIQRVMLDSEQPHDVAADLEISAESLGAYKRHGLRRLKIMMTPTTGATT